MTRERFLEIIRTEDLIRPGDRVVAALSGGEDSVCLLHLLASCREELGFFLSAAHMNHMLRGEESQRDERFVRGLCERMDVPLTVCKEDVRAKAKARKKGIEETARELRYRFFSSLPADKIAVAHHLDDQIETVLFRFARGTGLKGLCGMRMRRGNIIRPLLFTPKSEIHEYVSAQDLEFVSDSSNDDVSYARNRIRHEVLPSLMKTNSAFFAAAARCLRSVSLDEDFLEAQTEEKFLGLYDPKEQSLDIENLPDIHPALQRRLVLRYFQELHIPDPDEKHVLLLLDNILNTGYAVTLPSGTVVQIEAKRISVKRTQESPSCVHIPFSQNSLPTVMTFFDKTLRLSVTQTPPKPGSFAADADRLDTDLILRSPKAGDRIDIVKRNCTKTLKKLYTEFHIPAYERNTLPVIADSEGVIYAFKAGVDRSRIWDDKTKRFLIIDTEE